MCCDCSLILISSSPLIYAALLQGVNGLVPTSQPHSHPGAQSCSSLSQVSRSYFQTVAEEGTEGRIAQFKVLVLTLENFYYKVMYPGVYLSLKMWIARINIDCIMCFYVS